MTSSLLTYDVLVDHAAADAGAARELARRLRLAGLRPRLPGADAEGEAAVRVSRTTARIVGRCNTADASPDSNAHLAVLVPGCSLSPRRLAEPAMVDFRSGFETPRAWRRLNEILAEQRGRWDADRPLNPAALKRMVIDSYDHIAEKFAAQWFDYPPVDALEKFTRWLPRRALILDAGCGPGHHARFLSRCKNEVVGIDLSKAMLDIATRSVSSAAFLPMDIQSLAFPPQTFDGVWCAGAAMHVPREEVTALFRGFRSVVRPGGMVAINMQVGRDSELVEYGSDRRFFEYYRDAAEIARLVSRAGLLPVDFDYGETKRNTHGLDLTLKWATVYARRSDG